MHYKLFDMEWELIDAYGSGSMSYEYTYRHCFKTARLMDWIIHGST